MLKNSSLTLLKNKKNLLAFSAGVDSTALFFLLRDANIRFDIAIVDYGVREQSKDEVLYAKKLAQTYDIQCFIHKAKKIQKNFENTAREIRYNFFATIIKEEKYHNLITAHHLGDRFEWMLMQFCKGAGCVELAGMKESDKREAYTLIRPLLHLDKQELIPYLLEHNIKYFEDKTNLDETIKRNTFRHKFANPLLKKFLSGIKKSFEYIDEDKEDLIQEIEIQMIGELAYFQSTQNKRADIFAIDKFLKKNSYMPSSSERDLLKNKAVANLGRRYLVNQQHGFVFILPCITEVHTIPKEFKEECRVLKIEPKLRSFLYKNQSAFERVKELLTQV
ncbi:MAG: tRNA(Ile)-lysidine synthase [Sulfurimonas sp.]|jgi:tRNA(Ile)-lysidine synthase|uniref:tRNA lysidine(34) synthetase TilS n=1 Tax=Sulfurimonas sp. TaxID=2022749 RepID=UPI0039E64365